MNCYDWNSKLSFNFLKMYHSFIQWASTLSTADHKGADFYFRVIFGNNASLRGVRRIRPNSVACVWPAVLPEDGIYPIDRWLILYYPLDQSAFSKHGWLVHHGLISRPKSIAQLPYLIVVGAQLHIETRVPPQLVLVLNGVLAEALEHDRAAALHRLERLRRAVGACNCLSIYLSTYISIYPSIYLSVYQSPSLTSSSI